MFNKRFLLLGFLSSVLALNAYAVDAGGLDAYTYHPQYNNGFYLGLSGTFATNGPIGVLCNAGYMFQPNYGVELGIGGAQNSRRINGVSFVDSAFGWNGYRFESAVKYVVGEIATDPQNGIDFVGKLGYASVNGRNIYVDSSRTNKLMVGGTLNYGLTQHFYLGLGFNYFYSNTGWSSSIFNKGNKAVDFGMTTLDATYHF